MKVMVCGSRGWKDETSVYARLSQFPPGTEIMHGGAEGADLMAYWAALRLGLRGRSFLPDNNRPSPQRYHERNNKMLDRANLVIAFWDGKSPGTKSVIKKAEARGIPTEVVLES